MGVTFKAAEALSARDGDIAVLKTDIVLLKWMVGGLYVIVVPVAWLLTRVSFKLGVTG